MELNMNDLSDDTLTMIVNTLELHYRITIAHVSHRFRVIVGKSKVDDNLLQKFRNYRFERLIERHIDKVNWDWLSENSSMPPEFFERYIDKVDRKLLSNNNNKMTKFIY